MENKRVLFLGLDGADPLLMSRFLDEGYLPNIRKFLSRGVANEDLGMLGVQPTITPPNWASLATGAYPGTHGITCYWNHTAGNSLTHLDVGFNSRLCRSEFIWDAAIKAGKKAIVFNYPTSWPPTSEDIIAVDGTGINPNSKAYCEGEGFYYGDASFQDASSTYHEKNNTGSSCVVEDDIENLDFDVCDYEEKKTEKFVIGDDKRIDARTIKFKIDNHQSPISENADGVRETQLYMQEGRILRIGRLVAHDGVFDTFELYQTRKDAAPMCSIRLNEYSPWIKDSFFLNGHVATVYYKIKLLELAENGSTFKLYRSYVLDTTNTKYFHPSTICEELLENVGPMMHMSNCGLDDVMLETQAEMYEWIEDSILYLAKNKPWDVFYMHCHALDCCNHNYQNLILEEYTGDKAPYYLDIIRKYYEITDHLVGKMMALDDGNTVIVLASDHGGMSKEAGCEAPLMGDPWAVGGKVFEDMGYLSVDRSSGSPVIDWTRTRAIGQRSGYVYLNLKGRDPDGIVDPSEYDSLVREIIDKLMDYRDEHGRRPVCFAFNRQEMEVLGLYGDTVGDIYFVFNPEWTRVHGTSLTTHRYKGTSVKAFFAMMGPGVKENERIARRIRAVDVVPTVCTLASLPIPRDCEGAVLYQTMK